MAEIKCPKCGETFTIDKSSYDALLSEIEREELQKQLEAQTKHIEELYKVKLANEVQKIQNSQSSEVERLNNELKVLNEKLAGQKTQSKLDVQKALDEQKNELNSKDQEITELKNQIKNFETTKELAVSQAVDAEKVKLNDKDKVIADLQNQINNSKTNQELAVSKAVEAQKEIIHKRDEELLKLKGEVESAKKDAEIRLSEQKQSYDFALKAKDEEIERYKNFRMGDSTKDLGESLEQYCHDAFDGIRAYTYPKAKFEKDNDAVEGSKGDFVFKDYTDDGVEILSIMFEMKNQKDDTEHKHKNEDFFKKLDKDRTNKGCEYAVLVSTLEEDSKLYNAGIVDVSYRYPKMYVVRPQNFLAIIGLLKNMALEKLQYKQQVIAYQRENADITNFEAQVRAVAQKINDDYAYAAKQYEQVDKMCNDMIDKINAFREAFRLGRKWIGAAQNQLPDLEIRKLTKNNPTMKAKFDELKKDEDNNQ